MIPTFFEMVVQVFEEDGKFNWSLIQDFDSITPEALAYGYEDTFEAAVHRATEELKQMWHE